MTWQPIETAPKDGTVVILCDGWRNPVAGYWDDDADGYPWKFLQKFGAKVELNGFQDGEYGPSHWMPLPEPWK